jgi:hypothetical protein
VAELEALEVVESSLEMATSDLLAPWGGLPLANHIIFSKGSLDGLGGSSTVEGEEEAGQGDPFDIDDLTWDVGGGTINDDLLWN